MTCRNHICSIAHIVHVAAKFRLYREGMGPTVGFARQACYGRFESPKLVTHADVWAGVKRAVMLSLTDGVASHAVNIWVCDSSACPITLQKLEVQGPLSTGHQTKN